MTWSVAANTHVMFVDTHVMFVDTHVMFVDTHVMFVDTHVMFVDTQWGLYTSFTKVIDLSVTSFGM